MSKFEDVVIDQIVGGRRPTIAELEVISAIATAHQAELAAASEEAARNELDWLEKLEAMTHNGRGTILWEVDAISDEILARIAALTQRGEGGGK